jgi:hypothetical protein
VGEGNRTFLSGKNLTNHNSRILQVFSRETITACILSLPEVANGFGRFVQPSRSASSAINSTALKNFTAFVFGLPDGRSFPELTRMPTSSTLQFSNLPTCTASSLAGKSFAAQVVMAACSKSLFINTAPTSTKKKQ